MNAEARAETRAGQKLCSGFSEKKVYRIDAYKTIAAENEIERSCKRRITLFEQMASNGKCFTDRINVDWFMKFNFV